MTFEETGRHVVRQQRQHPTDPDALLRAQGVQDIAGFHAFYARMESEAVAEGASLRHAHLCAAMAANGFHYGLVMGKALCG